MPHSVPIETTSFQDRDGGRHVLLGFDARQNWLPLANWWPQNGPFLYVLREDTDRPYSVDKNIWSSVCHVVSDLARPDDAGPLPPLWTDEARLVRHLAGKPDLGSRPYSLIAVTLAIDTISPEAVEWLPLIGPNAPSLGPLGADWVLQGYDVANPKLLSALTDAPYHTEHENLAALKARWVPHLNEHHLLTSLDEARSFVPLAEQRVKRFAPFGAFGIWVSS